jgi:hypothetical protein
MIEPDELRALCQRIIQSGELGRSKTYAAILEYLAEQAINGTTPKEVAIAMDVLGRDSDFDVGKDSIVRVHIYHLRNKLSAYYARYGRDEPWRIDIPKGQYMLVSSRGEESRERSNEGDSAGDTAAERPRDWRWPLAVGLALIAIALLLVDLWRMRVPEAQVAATNPFAATALWQPLLDDDLPILILVGDYYIMGEADAAGNVQRMVREFDINSRLDLLAAQRDGRAHDYMNLDLNYVPTSVAPALAQVLKVLGPEAVDKRVQIKMMSEFGTTDLVGHHVIYLGYLSGLAGLTDLTFAASDLAIGNTYDELYTLDDDSTVYSSSSGLSVGEASYRDYGMLSTFPAPAGNQFVIIAGMRDEGLINLSEEVATLATLHQLEEALPQPTDGQKGASAFEALYEVLGFDNTNFDAKLVYKQPLDTQVLWESRLIGGQ